jgi:hypothetical protein
VPVFFRGSASTKAVNLIALLPASGLYVDQHEGTRWTHDRFLCYESPLLDPHTHRRLQKRSYGLSCHHHRKHPLHFPFYIYCPSPREPANIPLSTRTAATRHFGTKPKTGTPKIRLILSSKPYGTYPTTTTSSTGSSKSTTCLSALATRVPQRTHITTTSIAPLGPVPTNFVQTIHLSSTTKLSAVSILWKLVLQMRVLI